MGQNKIELHSKKKKSWNIYMSRCSSKRNMANYSETQTLTTKVKKIMNKIRI